MRNFIRLSLVLFLISILLVAGCNKVEEPPIKDPVGTTTPEKPPEVTPDPKPVPDVPAVKPGDYFPVVAGSTWEYEGEGMEFASFSREVLFTSENLAQFREDNGGTVSAAVFKITPEAVTRIFFLGEAYGEANYLNTSSNESIIILKAPLQVGTKWTEPNGTREIVDLNATVSTPLGAYTQCIKVKISNEHSTLYEYFKKDVGMVKREFISGDTKVSSSLKKHT